MPRPTNQRPNYARMMARASLMTDTELGKLLRAYLDGMIVDLDWEGFSDVEVKAIKKMLGDMNLAYENGLLDDDEQQDIDHQFRDEVCADMIREVVANTDGRTHDEEGNQLTADFLNEAVRNSIDIRALREFMGPRAKEYEPKETD